MAGTEIMNTESMARVLYGVADGEAPTESQLNSVTEMCRQGKLDAVKAGRRWLIRVEWPDREAPGGM